MSIVNHETGEIVETLNKTEARRLTDRIKLLAETIADQVEKMAALIDEARVGSAWLALGYSSWTAYVADEFGGVLPRLEREPRREFVRELADRGMSTRAIAPLVGTSHETVAQDIAAPVRNLTPQIPAAPRPAVVERPQVEESPSLPGTVQSPAPVVPEPIRPAVTGMDGKVYNFPKSKPKPVVLNGAAAEFDNAEQACKSLARSLSQLLSFEHSNMRDAMRRYWDMASGEVSPTQRADVTAEQMRNAAAGLLALAEEWEQ